MPVFKIAKKSADQVLTEFSVSLESGLSPKDAAAALERYGPNLPAGASNAWTAILFRQFRSPFLYLLFGAALIALLLGQYLDTLMILIFVAINTLLGFYQEYKSENTLKLLKRYMGSTARVRRGGKDIDVPSADLVPGDIVSIAPGDIVPADMRLVRDSGLVVDESILTGESAPVHKTSAIIRHDVTQFFQAQNICFAGTTVAAGKGIGVVYATGPQSGMGEIALLATQTSRTTNFEQSIRQLSTFILRLVLLTLPFIFFVNLLLKGPSADVPRLLIFAIALAVSVIPEALPVVLTFSLSRGALRLSKNKVVVKRLSAIEDLGSIEILCTDKTGTLTENQLTVSEVYGGDPARAIFLASCARQPGVPEQKRDAFDSALWNALSGHDRAAASAYEVIADVPFNPERRRNSVLVRHAQEHILIVRGAPEEIIKVCGKPPAGQTQELKKWITAQGRMGRRVLAVASKTLENADTDIAEEERHLELSGVISFVDPLKKTTRDAVNKAQSLGVQVKILTGDSPEVAGAVAREIGLIDSPERVLTGEEFDALHHQDRYAAALQYSVFARVSPQQKFRIIQVLQEKNEVGFLGEGINDAPALKLAHVALVVQGASDIAREAADIVLLKKSLNVIVDGIHEGRQVFANTIKYIKATLASNLGNFYAVAIASLLIDFLPMLPLQILLLNLLSDFPMIAIAADTVDKEELRRPRAYNIRDIALVSTFLGLVSTVFDFIFFALFYRISPAVLQTNWFMGSILTELLFVFSVRTRQFMMKASAPSQLLLILTGCAFVATVVVPFTQFGQHVFKFVQPSAYHLAVILVVASSYLIVTEAVKLLYYKFFSYKETRQEQHAL